MERAVRKLRDKRGQTSVEYLMLLAVAFITAYIMVTGPLADFTTAMVDNIRNNIQNMVKHAEWNGEGIEISNPLHPSNPERVRPLHL